MSTAEVDYPAGGHEPRRPVLDAARMSAAMLEQAEPGRLWALSEQELGAALGALQQTGQTVARLQVAVMAEADSRGVGAEQGWSRVDWAMRSAPGLSAREASALETVAQAASDPLLQPVTEAVETGVMSVPKAAQLVRFHREVRTLADPGALAEDLSTLVEHTPGLRENQLARAIRVAGQYLKPAPRLEREEETRRAARALYKTAGPCGMSTYRFVVDAEGAAILDAAIDPLARPQSEPDSGDRDPRSAATRRADALLGVIGRGVSSPGDQPKTSKSQVIVTMGYDQLGDGVRGAGLTMGDEVLSPATVRRLACDADIIPMVLGSRGETLDVGRSRRLITPAIRRVVWLRDRGCTYPGCAVPAQWCDGHHVIPWWRGGDTSVANTALLCPRHHTLAHARDLTATVTDTGVTWHL